MEATERSEDGFEESTAKVVTGIRTHPELKNVLINEAYEAGLSVSEYGEAILYNRHEAKKEVDKLSQFVGQQQQEIESLKAHMAANDAKQSDVVSAEIVELRKIIEQQEEQLEIYRDKRLLYLFEHLKGKTDKVENAYGEDFKITYVSVREVLLAIIYNTKLNQ